MATPLDEVLLQVRAEAGTGVLTLQGEEDIIAISFEEGRIVGADALNETLEQGLGRVLVAEGLVTEKGFEEAAVRVGEGEGRIETILVGDGLISHEDYLSGLRRYALALVERCRRWQSGDFKFYTGEDVSYEEGFSPIRVEEVVPPAAVVSDEAARAAAAEEEAATTAAAVMVAETELTGIETEPLEEPPTREEETEEADEASELSRLQAALRVANDRLADAPGWVARLAPTLIIVVLAVLVVWRPNFVVYPFFWLETERLELEKQRRTSVYQKIDRAAKTFFLLEGRFPDDLHTLVTRGLLSPDDIVGAGGRVLGYEPGDRGYVIRAGATDGTDPGVSKTEAIAGDFYLDPEFVIQPPDQGPTPLVLLD